LEDNSKSKLDTKTSKEKIHGNNVKKDEFSENITKSDSKNNSRLEKNIAIAFFIARIGVIVLPFLVPFCLRHNFAQGLYDFVNHEPEEITRTVNRLNEADIIEWCEKWLKYARGKYGVEGIVSSEHFDADNFKTQKSLILWLLALTRKVIELASRFGTEDNSEFGNNLKLMGFKMLHISQVFVCFYNYDMIEKLRNKFEENRVSWICQYSSWSNMLSGKGYSDLSSKTLRCEAFSEKILDGNIENIKDCLGLIMLEVKKCSTPGGFYKIFSISAISIENELNTDLGGGRL
jgi:hypothetical protein